MDTFIHELLSTLINPPGSLIYHMVLAYSIVAVIPTAWVYARSKGFSYPQRVLAGLIPMLVFLLLSFLAGSLAWQGVISDSQVLPPLDRSITITSLLLIIWLWAFPEPLRFVDITTFVLVLLTLTFGMIYTVFWSSQILNTPFNATNLDKIVQIISLVLILLGEIYLIARKPSGWNYGFFMLAILFLGHFWHLLFPDLQADYAGPVRLAQLASFPLLLSIPLRFISLEKSPTEPLPPASIPRQEAYSTQQSSSSFLSLLAISDSQELYREITRLVSQIMPADCCLLLSPPDQEWKITIHSSYDSQQNKFTDQIQVDRNQLPLIATALRHVRPFHIPHSKTTIDLLNLAVELSFENTGDLLGRPICDSHGKASLGLILISPHTQRIWTDQDQQKLTIITDSLAYLLQHREKLADLTRELMQMKLSYQSIQEDLTLAKQEMQAMPLQLDTAHSTTSNAFETHKEPQAFVDLESETIKMKRDLYELEKQRDTFKGELKLALEEIARLRSSTQDISLAPTSTASTIRAEVRQEELTDFTRETHHPFSSVNQDSESQSEIGAIYLNNIIDQTIQECKQKLLDKNIALHVDIPGSLPNIMADPVVMEQILTILLNNAIEITPKKGQISFRAELKMGQDQKEHILLQFGDQGGGISAEDLVNVFSDSNRSPIQGVGDSAASLFVIKKLVEAFGGQIWVDNTEPGTGAMFSVLMPVHSHGVSDDESNQTWSAEA